jgi:hypothetical protein
MVTLPRRFTSTDSELVPGLSLNAPRKLLDLIVDFCGVVRWSGVADPPVGRLFHRWSIIQKSPIGWRVDDVSDGHLAVSHDL